MTKTEFVEIFRNEGFTISDTKIFLPNDASVNCSDCERMIARMDNLYFCFWPSFVLYEGAEYEVKMVDCQKADVMFGPVFGKMVGTSIPYELVNVDDFRTLVSIIRQKYEILMVLLRKLKILNESLIGLSEE